MATRVTQALIYSELIALRETLEKHSAQDDRNFHELKTILNGNGNTPGMKVQLDRLEQKEQSREKEADWLRKRLLVIYGSIGSLVVGLALLAIR